MVAPDVFNSMGLPSLPPGLLPPAAAATNGVPGSPASSPSSATAAAAAPGAGQPAQADVFSQFMTQVTRSTNLHVSVTYRTVFVYH